MQELVTAALDNRLKNNRKKNAHLEAPVIQRLRVGERDSIPFTPLIPAATFKQLTEKSVPNHKGY